MRLHPLSLVLYGCATDVLVPPDGGGGGGGGLDVTVGASQTSSSGATTMASAGVGGEGGSPAMRTIVLDLDAPADADANGVVVVVSTPEGTVTGTWLGGELPVDAPANDGDLVWYLYKRATWSYAHTFRVTPEVTDVSSTVYLLPPYQPCLRGKSMTMALDIAPTDDAYPELRLAGANALGFSGTGENPVEVRACPGTQSFDLLLVEQESSTTDPTGFARIDGIPFVPGSTVELPIVFSSERELVDVFVEAQPGTSFGVSGSWYSPAFDNASVSTAISQTVGDSGMASLQYGPFALGSGVAHVDAHIPAGSWTCERESAWKVAPFDASPLHATFGTLAGLAMSDDTNVMIGPGGEVGDVMRRVEEEFWSSTPAYWELHEDPKVPRPLPVRPDFSPLLPDFNWPVAGFYVSYSHVDVTAFEGYADYARSNPVWMDGRMRQWDPDSCP